MNPFRLLLISSSQYSVWVIMLDAAKSGDVKDLAELMRQDPGFKVNMAVDGLGSTLLHQACWQ